MVVDLMLPDGDGAELVAEIKSRRSGLPVVVLSANDDLSGALEAGADVAMRIRACLSPRSSSPSDGPPIDGKDRTPEARESVYEGSGRFRHRGRLVAAWLSSAQDY